MTEWWVSQKKHWCTICKVWTGGHARQIAKHQEGRMHIEHEEQMLKDARTREVAKRKEKQDLEDELARIERAAAEAMATSEVIEDSAAGGTSRGLDPGELERQRLQRMSEKKDIQQTINDHHAQKRQRVNDGSEIDAPANCPWTRHKDPGSGHYYYHNKSTGQSAWHEPPGFADAQRAQAAAAAAAAAAKAAAAAPPPPPARATGQAPVAAAGAFQQVCRPFPAATQGGPAVLGAASSSSSATPPVAAGRPPPLDLRAGPGAVINDWVVCTDPGSGRVYYYNRRNGVSSWEKPAELGVDLSKPPGPPTGKKPPPPPPKKKKPANETEGVVGAWEEVAPEESQFGRPEEAEEARQVGEDSDQEEQNPLANAKWELMGRKGEWAPEDRELRQKEMFNKASNAAADLPPDDEEDGDDTAEKNVVSAFKITRQRAAGIRRRVEG